MIEAAKGTRDILPGEIARWQLVEARAREVFSLFGFREIRTPIFEPTELFARGVGEGTDIVAKEMYTFPDRKGRSLTLRPENTAPVARAYIEHSMHRGSDIERLYYIGPMFRYERPQKGRTRQFHQIGVEALGSEHPCVDAETLHMLVIFLGRLDIRPVELQISSVGCSDCRPAYRDLLVRELAPHRDRLCADCHRRLEINPLRCLDCKVPADRAIVEKVSPILDHLCSSCRAHLDAVRRYLGRLGVSHVLAPRLVRGIDYYRRTTFEVSLPGLGAQSALLGGGRYDGLVQSLGGPATPGFGFAVGEDRLVLSLPEGLAGAVERPDVFVALVGESAIEPALVSAARLRSAGRSVVLDPYPDRSLKAQMRRAHDLQARYVLLLGGDEVAHGTVTVKRMSDGTQRTVPEARILDALSEATHG
ncbi:MAG TPA: histidine--tRNA ligase [Patescibacteria group bacterium]|nr:histidine--tRNA ligase [Patescibacteria group bacterium]